MNNKQRRGFAIPTAVLVILVLTIMVAGGFSIVSAERRSVADQKSQISAFRIAEQGLEIYLIARDSLNTAGVLRCNPSPCQHIPAAKDSASINVLGGVANVSLTMIRPPINNQSGLYVVRSRGIETANAYNGSPQAVRTVAQYVLWEPLPMQVLAGWTALSGLQMNGNSGTIGGIDLCAGVRDTIAGVVVPLNPGYNGKTGNITGDPPIDTVTSDSVHIDWNSIINLNAITPTIVIPGGSFPTPAQFADTTFYPIIRVNGDLALPNTGQGMLIVTGNLALNGNVGWKGVLLVGGVITANGVNGGHDDGVQGAVVSGLNEKLGQVVNKSTANGTKAYNFNSCEVAKANRPAGALVTLRNTWVDNWVEY